MTVCRVMQGTWTHLLIQQLLMLLIYLTQLQLRIMPAFACKTYGPFMIRQHFKHQQG